MMNERLSKNSTIKEAQLHVAHATKQRGFDHETDIERILLMVEEVGELAKAVRKNSGIKIDPKSDKYHIRLEIADILFYLFHISNYYNIDLAEAFVEKEKINSKRTWK